MRFFNEHYYSEERKEELIAAGYLKVEDAPLHQGERPAFGNAVPRASRDNKPAMAQSDIVSLLGVFGLYVAVGVLNLL